MTNIIKVDKHHLQIVLAILRKHLPSSTLVWIFGSRANQTPKLFSDLDLAINTGTELSSSILIDIKHDFDESALPYKVDVIDWHSIDASFQAIILSTAIRLPMI